MKEFDNIKSSSNYNNNQKVKTQNKANIANNTTNASNKNKTNNKTSNSEHLTPGQKNKLSIFQSITSQLRKLMPLPDSIKQLANKDSTLKSNKINNAKKASANQHLLTNNNPNNSIKVKQNNNINKVLHHKIYISDYVNNICNLYSGIAYYLILQIPTFIIFIL